VLRVFTGVSSNILKWKSINFYYSCSFKCWRKSYLYPEIY